MNLHVCHWKTAQTTRVNNTARIKREDESERSSAKVHTVPPTQMIELQHVELNKVHFNAESPMHFFLTFHLRHKRSIHTHTPKKI